MKPLHFIPLVALLALPLAHAGGDPKTFGKIDRRDPAFDALIPKDAKIEKLAEGFKWTEGPVWIDAGKKITVVNKIAFESKIQRGEIDNGPSHTPDTKSGCLLFSDIPNNAIHLWQPGKGLTRDFIKPAGYTGSTKRGGEPGSNGLVLDSEGRLTLCEHGDRRITRLEKDGKKTVLADKYQGKRFNSPNDLVFDSKGNLYFSDPPYGLEKNYDDPARELDWCGVYRLAKDGTVTLLTKEMTRPNGVALSPDEKTLYVANSDPKIAVWKKFAIGADGSLGKGEVFYDVTAWVAQNKPGLPDGLKVDVKGNLFATGPGGVLVFDPSAKLLGVIDTGVPTANCAFGDDGSTLYIAANDSLAKIRTTTKGKGW
jgi:gluconolactonase